MSGNKIRNAILSVRRLAQRRFIRDTVILQMGQFASIVALALTNLLLARILGPDGMGFYAVIAAMAAVLGMLDLSASGRVTLMEVSRALGSGRHDEVRDSLAYFVRINVLINGALVVGFFVLAPWLAQVSYHNAEIGQWARWLALLELTELPYSLLTLSRQSQRSMRSLVSIETVRVLLASSLGIGVLVIGWGVPGYVLCQVAVSLAYAGYGVFAYARLARTDPRFPGWRVLLDRARSISLRSRFLLGFRIAVDKNIGGVAVQLPILLLFRIRPQEVGYFSMALKVMTLPQPLISGISRNLEAFLPFRAGQGLSSLRETFVATTLTSGFIWTVATLGMAVVGPILVLLVGAKSEFSYLPSVPLLYPLLLQSLAIGFGVGAGSTFRSLNKVEYSIAYQIIVLVICVPIGYWLINQFGGYGAAWFYGAWFSISTACSVLICYALLKRTVPGATKTAGQVPAVK